MILIWIQGILLVKLYRNICSICICVQEQQEYWYQQHRQNLQKLKNEKAKQNQNSSNGSNASCSTASSWTPKSTPPPTPSQRRTPSSPTPEESKDNFFFFNQSTLWPGMHNIQGIFCRYLLLDVIMKIAVVIYSQHLSCWRGSED